MVNNQDKQLFTVVPQSFSATEHDLDAARDKSLSHRAYMFATMAEGTSVIKNPLPSEDCDATKAICLALGAKETTTNVGECTLTSPGVSGWQLKGHKFDFGNSGTTARLMLGLLASVAGLEAEVDGDESLRGRPMARVTEPLTKMGAHFEFVTCPGYLPLRLAGKSLKAEDLRATKASAQIKSAIILAALNTKGKTSIHLPAGGRDHTELFLQSQKISLATNFANGHETIVIDGPCQIKPFQMSVPRDPSAAAFLWALPLVHGRGRVMVRDVLTNPTRIGFLACLRQMGADIREANPQGPESGFMEAVKSFSVGPGSELRPCHLTAGMVPACIDEIPILAAVAAFAAGDSLFEGLEELRVKESDRLAATERLLLAAGIPVETGEDWLKVKGDPGLGGQKLTDFDPQGDHRLAMAAAILGTKFGAEIRGAECVAVSFPAFFEILQSLG